MARVNEELYFSPKYKFTDLDWDSDIKLIDAFQDRVEGFYLLPAKELNQSRKYSFATGVLCVSTIDFLARIQTGKKKVGERFEQWLNDNISDFSPNDKDKSSRTIAHRFYDEFRNGLVHEGRIKNAGQFSYEFTELVNTKASVMIVNPDSLLNAINSAFDGYLNKLKEEESAFQAFMNALKIDFKEDIGYVNRQ